MRRNEFDYPRGILYNECSSCENRNRSGKIEQLINRLSDYRKGTDGGRIIGSNFGCADTCIEMENRMYQFENFQNKPLTARVADNIVSYIVDNRLEIGTKLPNEFELAEQFGVGRSTIREAIKTLVSKNLLEVRRGAGTYVINTSTVEQDPLGLSIIRDRYKLALDLVNVRLILEPEIAALAAENAKEEDLEELSDLCRRVETKILSNEDHMQEDIRFHTCIAKCSGNSVVEHLIPVINSSVAVFVNITHGRLREETIRTHKAVTESIKSRDVVGAKCAMVMHLTYNRQMILKIMEEAETNGKKE